MINITTDCLPKGEVLIRKQAALEDRVDADLQGFELGVRPGTAGWWGLQHSRGLSQIGRGVF